MFKNEEDIRAKLLMPFIENLGFEMSEISLEKSFSIRLGKNKHLVRGRSDILCHINGKNLFVVELKKDSLTISQEDIDQGISYARLLDNIAPFTIVSNGSETKVFDSVTKKELTGTNISEQSDFWRNDCTLSTDEDLRIRYTALKSFVSFSDSNLKIFCEAQVKDRMSPIVGNIEDSSSKFIKDLHVKRKILHDIFDKFIQKEASVFGIVGNAGVGKTSSMCSLALKSLQNNFVFFYNAALINKSPLHYISQDLNLFFSGKNDSEIVLKKLNEFGRTLNKKIIIFIDAIDENINANFSQEISEIAFVSSKLEYIKFCISCKLNIWNKFLYINDTKTHLYEELLKIHNTVSELDNNPGYFLKDFNNEEISDIIPLYQRAFGFKGQISESIIKELKNGFLLRIFSEVYSNKQVPEQINDIELIKTYIIRSFEKTNIELQTGLRILSKIGKILIHQRFNERSRIFKEDSIDIDILLEELNFSLDKNLPEDLFTRNILLKSYSDDSLMVSFYYSKIRDFIICNNTFKLRKLDSQEFYDILDSFYINHIGQSAIDFYIENASSSQLDAFKKFKKDKAQTYVINYSMFLDKNFHAFKKEFDPNTDGEIGIILPRDLVKTDGYSLFPLKDSKDHKVQLESFEKVHTSSFDYYKSLFFQRGAKTFYSSNASLMSPNQDQIVEKNIFKRLKKIVEKGKLNEYCSNILLIEKVVTILYFYYKKLDYHYNVEDYYLPRYDLIYPIDLNELRERIYTFRAKHYFKRQKVERSLVDKKVADAVKMQVDIPKLNVTGDFPPFEELFKIVNILLSKGFRKIEEKDYLPFPDKSLKEVKTFFAQKRGTKFDERRNFQYSDIQAKKYISQFFKNIENAYREIIEYNFPTFANEFPFLRTYPHEYFFYIRESDVQRWWFYGYRSSLNGEVNVNFRNVTSSSYEETRKGDGISIIRGFSFTKILYNDYYSTMQTIDKIRASKVDEFCVVRSWLYKILKDDIKMVFKEN